MPSAPLRLLYLLNIFEIMGRGRRMNPPLIAADAMGNARIVAAATWLPLAPTEIDAGTRLLGITLRAWELDALLRLDDVWREVQHEQGNRFDDA